MEDHQAHTEEGERDSSDSEIPVNAMDERPYSDQGELSSLENQISSLAANTPVEPAAKTNVKPSEDTHVTMSEKSVASVEKISTDTSSGKPDGQKSNELKSNDTVCHHATLEDSKNTTSQSGKGKKSKAANPPEPKTDKKNSNNKNDTTMTIQSSLDQNANLQPDVRQTKQTKQKVMIEQGKKQKEASASAETKMMFGPYPKSKVRFD